MVLMKKMDALTTQSSKGKAVIKNRKKKLTVMRCNSYLTKEIASITFDYQLDECFYLNMIFKIKMSSS